MGVAMFEGWEGGVVICEGRSSGWSIVSVKSTNLSQKLKQFIDSFQCLLMQS